MRTVYSNDEFYAEFNSVNSNSDVRSFRNTTHSLSADFCSLSRTLFALGCSWGSRLSEDESENMKSWVKNNCHPADSVLVGYSYNTPIALKNVRTGEKYVTSAKYSRTTTAHTTGYIMG